MRDQDGKAKKKKSDQRTRGGETVRPLCRSLWIPANKIKKDSQRGRRNKNSQGIKKKKDGRKEKWGKFCPPQKNCAWKGDRQKEKKA